MTVAHLHGWERPDPPAVLIVAGTYAHARDHRHDVPDGIPTPLASIGSYLIGQAGGVHLWICYGSLVLATDDTLARFWDEVTTRRPKTFHLSCERP